jgi:hypothetical protein
MTEDLLDHNLALTTALKTVSSSNLPSPSLILRNFRRSLTAGSEPFLRLVRIE